jgi:serine protease
MSRHSHRSHRIPTLAAAMILSIAGSSQLVGGVLPAADPIEDQYIVVLRGGAVKAAGAGFDDSRPTVGELTRELAREHRGRSGREFSHALAGFALRAERAEAERLAADPRVAYVAQDSWVYAAGQQAAPSWGLDRVDQRPKALDGSYSFYSDGQLVDVYVIDSGIRSTHFDFEGRVDLGASFSTIDDGLGTEDCLGHGTHVAGIIAGATYGVAKQATLHPVRVLDCGGRGAASDIIAGIDWITARYATTTTDGGTGGGGGGKGGGKKQTREASAMATGAPAVVNMSLATYWVQAIDDAVAKSVAAGVTYVVAAGNSGIDACEFSPARGPAAITVGATDANDARVATSNFGGCVDLFAPGASIVSTYIRSDSDAVAMSGTSMAAPHVTGAVALLLAVNPALTPAEVRVLLDAATTGGVLTNLGAGSPNRLLFAPFTGDGVDMAPVADFTSSCASGTCKFNAGPSVDDRGILAYSWDFGGLKTASGEAVSVKLGRQAPSQIVVALEITDTVGQVTRLERTVATGN